MGIAYGKERERLKNGKNAGMGRKDKA